VLGGPLSHIMAAKAVALAEARTEAFRDYAHRVVDNARALAEGLLKRGGTLVTGGTDNHIVLLDVSSFGLTGRQAESALLDSGIVTNRNSVPNDPNGAWYTSGIRLGTPALTSRGFTTSDMDEVAAMITDVLKKTTPTTTKDGKPGKAKYELAQEVAVCDIVAEASASASSQAKPQQGPTAGAPSSNGGSVPDGASAGSQSSSRAGSSDHNEVVVGAGSSQDAKGRTSAAERPSAQSVRERWLPVTGVAIGVLSVAAILLSAGLIVLRLRRA